MSSVGLSVHGVGVGGVSLATVGVLGGLGVPASTSTAPSAPVDCDPRYLSQDDLLALVERVLPPGYLVPLREVGPGYELLQALAATASRASLGVGRSECQLSTLTAAGPARSEVEVTFRRDSIAAGAFTLLEGTVVRASRSGREYALVADVAFAAGDVARAGVVRSLGHGPEYDLPGRRTALDGTTLVGEIDDVVVPLMDPVLAETTLHVEQVDDASGGVAGALDQIGEDRGLTRLALESDDEYRARVRALPDTVSPDALRRQLDAVFLPRGLEYELIETWENRLQGCWDTPDVPVVHPVMGQSPALAWDDDSPGFHGRWLDLDLERGAVVVVVPDVPLTGNEFGMAWDDPALTAAEHVGPRGRRAHSAWDVPDGTSDAVLRPAFDGSVGGGTSGRDALYRAVYDLLRAIKGGGVKVVIELEGQ